MVFTKLLLSASYNLSLVDEYYSHTTGVVVDQLRCRLAGVDNRQEQSLIWKNWIDTWCHFSLISFLTSTHAGIVAHIPQNANGPELNKLGYLLPWPQAAITAYTQYSYTEQLDQSLVQYLRDQMGEWWSEDMHRFDGGMSELPNTFEKENKQKGAKNCWDIVKNFTVNKITYSSSGVCVCGYTRKSSNTTEYDTLHYSGDAVIVTTPVHILRQIKFEAAENTTPLPYGFYNAISDIWYGPSTKIMIECKTKFWEKKDNICGGFTKTTLPIGQLHYPSSLVQPRSSATDSNKVKRGILLIYTWKSEALMFGSLPPKKAVEEAVEQIAEIHPEIKDKENGFSNVWAIEPWYNEPSSQGAYCLLKPNQYQNVVWLMYPWGNLYFAGEAISFASGWIQGALESGLRAAYQFYVRNERASK